MNSLGFAVTGLFPLVTCLGSWLRAPTTIFILASPIISEPILTHVLPVAPPLAFARSLMVKLIMWGECGESLSQGQLSSMGKGAHGRTLCLNLRRMILRDILCSSQRAPCRTEAPFSFLSGHLSNTPFMLIFLRCLIHSLVLCSSSFFSPENLAAQEHFSPISAFGGYRRDAEPRSSTCQIQSHEDNYSPYSPQTSKMPGAVQKLCVNIVFNSLQRFTW